MTVVSAAEHESALLELLALQCDLLLYIYTATSAANLPYKPF